MNERSSIRSAAIRAIMSDLRINHDRRVADVQTVYDPVNGDFNSLFATAIPLVKTIYDGSGHPPLKPR